MPNQQEHLKKASHNENFYQSLALESTPYKDWLVVGVFYTALHFIDAYLAKRHIHPFSHAMRDDWVKKNRELDEIWLDYRDLKEFRMKASYKIYEFTTEEIRRDVHDGGAAAINKGLAQRLQIFPHERLAAGEREIMQPAVLPGHLIDFGDRELMLLRHRVLDLLVVEAEITAGVAPRGDEEDERLRQTSTLPPTVQGRGDDGAPHGVRIIVQLPIPCPDFIGRPTDEREPVDSHC